MIPFPAKRGGQEALDCLDLPFPIPSGAIDVAIRGVVQGPAVARVGRRIGVSPGGQQHSRDFHAIPRRGQMQRSVPHRKPMKDLRLKQSDSLFCATASAASALSSDLDTWDKTSATVPFFGASGEKWYCPPLRRRFVPRFLIRSRSSSSMAVSIASIDIRRQFKGAAAIRWQAQKL